MNPKDEAANRQKKFRHEYYVRHREEALTYQRQYDREHKDKRREYMRAYVAEYRKRLKARGTPDSEE